MRDYDAFIKYITTGTQSVPPNITLAVGTMYLLDSVDSPTWTLPKVTAENRGESIKVILGGSAAVPVLVLASGDVFAYTNGQNQFGVNSLCVLTLTSDGDNGWWAELSASFQSS